MSNDGPKVVVELAEPNTFIRVMESRPQIYRAALDFVRAKLPQPTEEAMVELASELTADVMMSLLAGGE